MKPRVCPRCKSYMSEDEDGWWCSNEECDYEIVAFGLERIEKDAS